MDIKLTNLTTQGSQGQPQAERPVQKGTSSKTLNSSTSLSGEEDKVSLSSEGLELSAKAEKLAEKTSSQMLADAKKAVLSVGTLKTDRVISLLQ